MQSTEELDRIVRFSRSFAQNGLESGQATDIPLLKIDIVGSGSFLGVGGNPAIFVTQVTYNKLKRIHPDWQPNLTIAIKPSFIQTAKVIHVIGALIHETGHAFNVYSGIKNTETNAYIFEIEAMLKLSNDVTLRDHYDLKDSDFKNYFRSRMQYYQLSKKNKELNNLVDQINKNFLTPKKTASLNIKLLVHTNLLFSTINNKIAMTPKPAVPTMKQFYL